MKEYFSHDHHARADEKIIKMLRVNGPEGYGLYWMIVEMLHENQGSIPKDYELLAYELRTQCERIKAICEDYDLFYEKDGRVFSLSVDRRLQDRAEKSSKAKASATKRWGNNAPAMPPQCERIADPMRSEGYKRKGKERKEEGEGSGPPTIQQVREYGESEHLKADPAKFHDWQSAKGWSGVIDWRASFRYWDKTEFPDKAVDKPQPQPRQVWEDTAGKEIARRNAWHDAHSKGGKCKFCGADVPNMGVCHCAEYGAAFEEFCQEVT